MRSRSENFSTRRASISVAFKLASISGLIAAAIGCGPVYDTQYQFTPPETSAGRSCIFQCENSRQQCRQLEDYHNEDCERHSEIEKERCEDDLYRRKGREPKWYECGTESCSANYDRCDEIYRSCYQSCGGDVHADTRCVANCDQIPPAQQPPAEKPAPQSAPYKKGASHKK